MIAVAPGIAMSAAVTVAVSCDALTYCITRAEVPQYTVELGRKFTPLTVMARAVPPALAMAGVIFPKKGKAFGLTVKVTAAVSVV